MKFNQIVEMEVSRGRAIFQGAKASGGTITNEMRKVLAQLNNMGAHSQAGEEMDQSDAAAAVNMADELSGLASSYPNGYFWSLTQRASSMFGERPEFLVMVMGIAAMLLTFWIPTQFNVTSNAIISATSSVAAVMALIAYSVVCAGCIIGNRRAGLIRSLIAFISLTLPLFPINTVLTTVFTGEGSSNYLAMISFYFAQGVAVFLMSIVFGRNKGSDFTPTDTVDGADDYTFQITSHATDPNYSGLNMGHMSDPSEI